MKIFRLTKLAYLLFTIVFLLHSCSNDNKKNKLESTKNDYSQLENKITKWQQELNIPATGVGIIDNGEIVFSKVISPSDTLVNQDLLFNIASITKVVFGTTVMKLVNTDKWNLDEPIYPYHIDEDVKDDPRHKLLTARHILSQQSGFVNWRWNHPTEKLTFDFDPGTTFNYSGEGMEYLRLAIEKRYNTTIDKIADSLIFTPAAMTNTSHSWDGISNFDKFSRFYDTSGKEHKLDDYSFTGQAADDIMTTVDDLTRFGLYILNGAELDADIYNEMVSPQTAITDNQEQALAWRLIQNLPNNEYAIHHGGNDIGVATLIVLLPKSKRGIVVMTNSDSGLVMCNNIVREVWKEGPKIIHRAYRSGSMNEIPKAIKVPSEILKTYEGVYEQPSGRKVTISSAKEGLLMVMPGVPNLQLLPKTENEFFLNDFDPIIAFEQGDDDTSILKIIEGENIIECKKL
ncbi:serine hydrolase [uncultured Croceitalea sp.]|uniref:serine hydrolase n=1 Tax=uncultured Croceitalea sp. TaxID=1798908 RepID=UPI0033061738